MMIFLPILSFRSILHPLIINTFMEWLCYYTNYYPSVRNSLIVELGLHMLTEPGSEMFSPVCI